MNDLTIQMMTSHDCLMTTFVIVVIVNVKNQRLLTKTNIQSSKTFENSEDIDFLRCWIFALVIWSVENSKTSSDNNFKMIILFLHKLSEVFDAPQISKLYFYAYWFYMLIRLKKLTRNECRPVFGPFLLQNLYKNHVQFVKIYFFFFWFFGIGTKSIL